MKRQSAFKIMVLTICTLTLLLFVSCSNNSPNTTVSGFFNAIKNSDLTKAKSYFVKNDSTLEFTNQTNKNVVVNVLSKIKYNIISIEINDD